MDFTASAWPVIGKRRGRLPFAQGGDRSDPRPYWRKCRVPFPDRPNTATLQEGTEETELVDSVRISPIGLTTEYAEYTEAYRPNRPHRRKRRQQRVPNKWEVAPSSFPPLPSVRSLPCPVGARAFTQSGASHAKPIPIPNPFSLWTRECPPFPDCGQLRT